MRPHARAVVCACLLPVALLVVDPAGYSPFGPSFGVFTWVLCALLFLAGQSLDDDDDARLIVGAAVAAGGLAGAWALAEEFGWRPTGADTGSRLIGSMGSAAFLGTAMALVLPMAIGVAADRSWDRRYRVAAGASAAAALVGSGARAAGRSAAGRRRGGRRPPAPAHRPDPLTALATPPVRIESETPDIRGRAAELTVVLFADFYRDGRDRIARR